MKKLAICCLVMALAALFVPVSQAAPRCITFTNFCDRIEFDTTNVGGVEGTVFFGSWDWECASDPTSSIIGNGGTKFKVGTRPIYVGTDYAFAYSAGFTFKKAGLLFDLYGTNGPSAFAFQLAQPWTQASGSCGFARTHSNGKARLTAR